MPEPFTLTKEVITRMFDAAATGDISVWLGTIDPDVEWVIARPDGHDKRTLAGTYDYASWTDKVLGTMLPHLDGALKMELVSVEIIGNKAILETRASAPRKDGRMYTNFYAWFMTFSPQGKIVKLREYLDSSAVRDLLEGTSKSAD
ncbi:Nuclear transport factor 2 family protein [Mycena kentingensis (nom. inval.)]|nr:Nuclear transport factor 2 family protein [Mycena kentingensis (nom. inval.)]